MSNRPVAIVKFSVSILFFVAFLGTSLLSLTDRVKGQAPACPLTGGTIVEFGKEIRSDRSEDEARAGPVSVSLPAGTYRVVLVSYDNHFDKPYQEQPAEQWYLIFQRDGETVVTSSSIRDLPSEEEWLIEVVDYNLVVPQDVTSLVAFHSAWPDREPNSITPICATLHRTDEERPTATATATVAPTPPTPTPTFEPGITPTPTATAMPTASPTPTPEPPKQQACARFNLEQGQTPGCPAPGRYEMIEVGTGRLLATWWAEKGWVDSGWITGIDLTWPEVWVEVFFYPFGNEPAVKMHIVNPASGTQYGWLARGMCHSVEIEFPPGWSSP